VEGGGLDLQRGSWPIGRKGRGVRGGRFYILDSVGTHQWKREIDQLRIVRRGTLLFMVIKGKTRNLPHTDRLGTGRLLPRKKGLR